MRAMLFLSFTLTLAALAGCSEGGNVAGSDSGVPPGTDGGVPPGTDGGPIVPHDSGPLPDGGPVAACVGLPGVTLSNVVAELHPDAGVLHPGSRTLLSVPHGLTPSLTGLTSVQVADTMLTVATMPVTQTAPIGGEVFASVWSPALDRIVSVVYASNPYRYVAVASQIGASGVTMTPLTSADALDPDGPILGPLYAVGSSIVAMRGDSYHVLAIDLAAGTVTWGAPTMADTTNQPMAQTSDPAHGRILGYGLPHFVPPMTVTIDPGVATRGLPPSSPWSPIPGPTGMTPPSTDFMGVFTGWLAYDETSDRLFVVQYHTVTGGPFGDHMITGLWSVSMTTGDFTLHQSEYYEGQGLYGSPYAIDTALQRTLEPMASGLNVRSLAMGSEGQLATVAQDGELTPHWPDAAARLGDGRIVVSENGTLHVLDPSSASPRWSALGTAAVPMEHRFGAVLVHDGAMNRLLAVGGATSSSDTPTSFSITAFAEDGTTATPITTSGGPSARARHSAIVVGHELIVVGGLPTGFAGTGGAAVADVWALDLGTTTWRAVGSLPEPRAGAALRVQPDGTLWVIGGYASTSWDAVSSVVAIDLTSGAVSPIGVSSAWPPGGGVFSAWTTLGAGVLAIDLGGTVDMSGGQLWQLVPDGASAAHWTGGDACGSDYAFYEVVGVPDAGNEGWLAGAYTWHAH